MRLGTIELLGSGSAMQSKAMFGSFRSYLHHPSSFYIQTGWSQTSIRPITSLVKSSFKFYKHSINIVFQNFFLEMFRYFRGPPSPWLCNAGSNSSVTRRRIPSSGSALKTTLQRWPTFAHLGVPFEMGWSVAIERERDFHEIS